MTETPTKNLGGRPHSLVVNDATLRQLEGLGRINCTTKEAAAFLRVTEKTFIVFLQQNEEAHEAFESAKGVGKLSLRRKQFQMAENGNVTMLIWLGKQHLGQKDKLEQSSDPEAPVRHVIEYIITDPAAPKPEPPADDGQ